LDYRGRAIGWAMQIERLVDVMPDNPKLSKQVVRRDWFGRVRDERGHWSFGPSTLNRTRAAIEAWLKYEPLDKLDGERTWRGDCGPLLIGHALTG
jgi:hypothetical protein